MKDLVLLSVNSHSHPWNVSVSPVVRFESMAFNIEI